jgi:hypothetical protein
MASAYAAVFVHIMIVVSFRLRNFVKLSRIKKADIIGYYNIGENYLLYRFFTYRVKKLFIPMKI